MYTPMVLFALTFAAPSDLSWSTDYPSARQQSEAAGKPVAVFIGSGANGWQKLSRGSEVGAELRQFMAANYVCVYIDTATETGKSLATAFEVPDGLGIVISDRSGALQAFRHEGDLAQQDLDRYLRRFADPSLVIRTTESNPGNERRSGYYAPAGGCPHCPR